jgi:hypothetical protein
MKAKFEKLQMMVEFEFSNDHSLINFDFDNVYIKYILYK